MRSVVITTQEPQLSLRPRHRVRSLVCTHSQSLDWYWQTKQYRKIHKPNVIKTTQNTAKENYPRAQSPASYDTRPRNEVSWFYNIPSPHGANCRLIKRVTTRPNWLAKQRIQKAWWYGLLPRCIFRQDLSRGGLFPSVIHAMIDNWQGPDGQS